MIRDQEQSTGGRVRADPLDAIEDANRKDPEPPDPPRRACRRGGQLSSSSLAFSGGRINLEPARVDGHPYHRVDARLV